MPIPGGPASRAKHGRASFGAGFRSKDKAIAAAAGKKASATKGSSALHPKAPQRRLRSRFDDDDQDEALAQQQRAEKLAKKDRKRKPNKFERVSLEHVQDKPAIRATKSKFDDDDDDDSDTGRKRPAKVLGGRGKAAEVPKPTRIFSRGAEAASPRAGSVSYLLVKVNLCEPVDQAVVAGVSLKAARDTTVAHIKKNALSKLRRTGASFFTQDAHFELSLFRQPELRQQRDRQRKRPVRRKYCDDADQLHELFSIQGDGTAVLPSPLNSKSSQQKKKTSSGAQHTRGVQYRLFLHRIVFKEDPKKTAAAAAGPHVNDGDLNELNAVLLKKSTGKLINGWLQRWFTVSKKDLTLSYWKSKADAVSGKQAKSIYHGSQIQSVEPGMTDTRMLVHLEHRTLHLQAADAPERERWIRWLVQVSSEARAMAPPAMDYENARLLRRSVVNVVSALKQQSPKDQVGTTTVAGKLGTTASIGTFITTLGTSLDQAPSPSPLATVREVGVERHPSFQNVSATVTSVQKHTDVTRRISNDTSDSDDDESDAEEAKQFDLESIYDVNSFIGASLQSNHLDLTNAVERASVDSLCTYLPLVGPVIAKFEGTRDKCLAALQVRSLADPVVMQALHFLQESQCLEQDFLFDLQKTEAVHFFIELAEAQKSLKPGDYFPVPPMLTVYQPFASKAVPVAGVIVRTIFNSHYKPLLLEWRRHSSRSLRGSEATPPEERSIWSLPIDTAITAAVAEGGVETGSGTDSMEVCQALQDATMETTVAGSLSLPPNAPDSLHRNLSRKGRKRVSKLIYVRRKGEDAKSSQNSKSSQGSVRVDPYAAPKAKEEAMEVIISKAEDDDGAPEAVDAEVGDDLGAPLSELVVFKCSDVRRDVACLLLFRLMNRIWRQRQVTLSSPGRVIAVSALIYKCVAVLPDMGLIEYVPDTVALSDCSEADLKRIVASRDGALDTLIASSVGSYLACFVLGIRDRHNDNILVRSDGSLFHIDFGNNVLGKKEMVDTGAFAITRTLQAGMGTRGWDTFIRLSIAAFSVLRSHAVDLIQLSMLLFAPFASAQKVTRFLGRSLMLDMDLGTACMELKRMLEAAPNSTRTRMKNYIHSLATGKRQKK